MKKILTLLALLISFIVITAQTSNAQTTATVTAVALQPSVSVGTPAVVEIRITGGQNLSSYNFVLSYNPAVLQINTPSTSVTNGPFLASSGRSVSPLPPSVNNTTGTVEFGTFSYGGLDNGASGNGVLATITFTTLSAGNSPLNLSNVQLYQADLNATAQPNTAVNGTQIVSAVALPSPTPTPGASASPNDASVTIQASFEGLDQDRGDKLVNVQLVRAGSSPIVRNGVRFVYSAPGVYTTQTPLTDTTLIAGTYNVYLNGPTHLTKLFGNQVVNAGSTTLNLVSSPPILTADIIDDNTIDTLDFNRMIDNFGCRLNVNPPVEPVGKTCTPLASDVDFDNDVDIFDYSYLVGNYNITGD